MARYINKKTKAVIDTDCKMLGNWVLAGTLPLDAQVETTTETTIEPPKIDESPKEPVDFTGDAAYDGINKKQIMQELDAFGIEYNPKANKPELYALMMAQGE